jgi:hypothetical protein
LLVLWPFAASSFSSRPKSGISANTLPLAGFVTEKCLLASRHSPPIEVFGIKISGKAYMVFSFVFIQAGKRFGR